MKRLITEKALRFRHKMDALVHKVGNWEALLTSLSQQAGATMLVAWPPQPPKDITVAPAGMDTVAVRWNHPDGFAVDAPTSASDAPRDAGVEGMDSIAPLAPVRAPLNDDDDEVTAIDARSMQPRPCKFRYLISLHRDKTFLDAVDQPLMRHYEYVGQTLPGARSALLSGECSGLLSLIATYLHCHCVKTCIYKYPLLCSVRRTTMICSLYIFALCLFDACSESSFNVLLYNIHIAHLLRSCSSFQG